MARLGQQDFLPKQRMLRAQSDLRAVEKEVRSVGAAMERLNTKARLNGGDFSAQQRQVAEAQASLFRALKDGRRTNFTAELNQLRDAMARYGGHPHGRCRPSPPGPSLRPNPTQGEAVNERNQLSAGGTGAAGSGKARRYRRRVDRNQEKGRVG